MRGIEAAQTGQRQRNKELLGGVRYLGEKVHSEVLPLTVDIGKQQALHQEQIAALEGLQIEAAAISDPFAGLVGRNRRTGSPRRRSRADSFALVDFGDHRLRTHRIHHRTRPHLSGLLRSIGGAGLYR